MDLRERTPFSRKFSEAVIRFRWPLFLLVGIILGVISYQSPAEQTIDGSLNQFSVQNASMFKGLFFDSGISPLHHFSVNPAYLIVFLPLLVYIGLRWYFWGHWKALAFFVTSILVFESMIYLKEGLTYFHIALYSLLGLSFLLMLFVKWFPAIVAFPFLVLLWIWSSVQNTLFSSLVAELQNTPVILFQVFLAVMIVESLEVIYKVKDNLVGGKTKLGGISNVIFQNFKNNLIIYASTLVATLLLFIPNFGLSINNVLYILISIILSMVFNLVLTPAFVTIFPVDRIRKKA